MIDKATAEDFVKNNIQWLGHDGFLIKAGDKKIAIDPFEIHVKEMADLILVSHAHSDHCSPNDIEKLRAEKTVIITEPESASQLSGHVQTMKPGDAITAGDIKIEAVPAYNTNKEFHPESKAWLGFILTIDGIRIYHAGDTDLIEEMHHIDADIALLPVSGTYVMTANEAVEAAKRIKPTIAIPMHYGSIVGDENDASKFKKELEGICTVHIMSKQ